MPVSLHRALELGAEKIASVTPGMVITATIRDWPLVELASLFAQEEGGEHRAHHGTAALPVRKGELAVIRALLEEADRTRRAGELAEGEQVSLVRRSPFVVVLRRYPDSPDWIALGRLGQDDDDEGMVALPAHELPALFRLLEAVSARLAAIALAHPPLPTVQ